MNQKNFEYLQDQLKYTGFGQGLTQQLLAGMQKQLPEFTLQHKTQFGNDELAVSLNFQRSAKGEHYYFKSYLASLKNQDQTQRVNQLFYVQPAGSITLKEAFNLLQGRAVEKQLVNRQKEPYRAWLQIDFKNTDQEGNFKIRQYHQNYGYDLSKEVSRLSLKELKDDQSKARLLDSLRKGNRQQVTLVDQDKEHKFFIEANPQFKGIIAYDGNSVRQQIQAVTSLQPQAHQKTASLSLISGQANSAEKYKEQGLSSS